MVSFYSSRHVSNLEVSVQRHICSYPGISPQVTSFCVFQCLVWQLDRSEVMGSGLFLVWVNSSGTNIGGKRARSPKTLHRVFG